MSVWFKDGQAADESEDEWGHPDAGDGAFSPGGRLVVVGDLNVWRDDAKDTEDGKVEPAEEALEVMSVQKTEDYGAEDEGEDQCGSCPGSCVVECHR